MTVAEKVKEAADSVEAEFPGAHVICVAVHEGVVFLNAKSDVINDKLDCLAALNWVIDQTVKQTAREVFHPLSKTTKFTKGQHTP